MYRISIYILLLCIGTLNRIHLVSCQEVKVPEVVVSPNLDQNATITTSTSPSIIVSSNSTPNYSFNATRIFTKRPLTPEEQEMADKARAHIAEVVKQNLIRLFAVIAANNQRESRQFEDEDDGDDNEGFNPNTLPQVAQLLGAIFSGNLNLTNIVDRAFFLVPDTLRNQVSGIFQLLTGQPTTAAPTPAAVTLKVVRTTVPTTTEAITEPPTTELAPDVVASFVISSPGRNKTKYKVRRKLPSTTLNPIAIGSEEYEIITDDELRRLEQTIIERAKETEPVVNQTPSPAQDFMGQLRQVFANTNMTAVIQALPDIFNGARQAYVLLDSLGQLDDLPNIGDLLGLDDDDE